MSLSERVEQKRKINPEQKERLFEAVRGRLLAEEEVATGLPSKKNLISRIYPQVRTYLEAEGSDVSLELAEDLAREVCERLFGLGPIEPFLADDQVTDIMIQNTEMLIIKNGRKESLGRIFSSLDGVKRVIDRIVFYRNKKVDLLNPNCDVELYDGSRCHIIIPPASDRIYLSIRKYTCVDKSIDELVEEGMLSKEERLLLERALIEDRKNILVSGGTGAGKTTFINTLGKLIPENHIVVIIEDTPELRLPQSYVRSLRTRDSSKEGVETISQIELLKYALRMNPDRIVLGEVREPLAAYQLIHTLNTGHKGSLSTIHADSAYDALWRLENLALEYSQGLNLLAIRREIARVINLVVHIQALEDGEGNIISRKVSEMLEVSPGLDDGNCYLVNDVRRRPC